MTHDRFAHRRAEFLERLGDTIAIVPAGKEQVRNDDVDHAFRQESDFFFLTGFNEPDAVAVFDPTDMAEPYVLFVRPRDPELEAWNGRRAGTAGAVEAHDADAAFTIAEFDDWIRVRLRDRTSVAYSLGGPYQASILSAMASARDHGERMGLAAPGELIDPRTVLHEMRVFKSSEEIAALRRACRISAMAHVEAMRFTRPGLTERHVEAAIEYVFRAMGAERVGYGSIVAGGINAVILHYVENDQPLADGDLLLIDAGAEYRHLTADITRTFPVNGAFTAPQRAIYDIVLETERSVIDQVAPGLAYSDMHTHAIEVLAEGMVELGVLPGPVDEVISKGWYREFYFHGTGHWLGIDVHDAGAYRVGGAGRPLEPGMAFTVEPGIYIAPEKHAITLSHALYDADEAMRMAYELGGAKAKAEHTQRRKDAGRFDFEVPAEFLGIGVRIEDDILVTEDGYDNMTALVPTDPAEIEALCAEESPLPLFD
ncbi:MAG: aminopeptidase P N-terminal domain-containing protein [Acidimicrobiia bacterium]